MKVEIDTKEKSVYLTANDRAMNLQTLDKWIEALRTARRWLKRQTPEQTK